MDTKIETCERLIKNGSISLYEALALLDWGKIDVTTKPGPIELIQPEPDENAHYLVVFRDTKEKNWQVRSYEYYEYGRATTKDQARDNYEKLKNMDRVSTGILTKVVDRFIIPVPHG